MANDKARKRANDNIGWMLASDEEIIFVAELIKNSIILTNKSIIYIDVAIAKSKNYSIVPYTSIKGLTFKEATGLSAKMGLKIMGGGDRPLIEIESLFNDDFKELCKIINENIG